MHFLTFYMQASQLSKMMVLMIVVELLQEYYIYSQSVKLQKKINIHTLTFIYKWG